ncbi:MAG: hypothetical protein ACLPGW_19630 [Roseiarcus sp.]
MAPFADDELVSVTLPRGVLLEALSALRMRRLGIGCEEAGAYSPAAQATLKRVYAHMTEAAARLADALGQPFDRGMFF